MWPRPAKFLNGSFICLQDHPWNTSPRIKVKFEWHFAFHCSKRIQNPSEVRRRKWSPKTSSMLCSLSTMAPPISYVPPRVFQSQHSGTSCLLRRLFFFLHKEPIGSAAPKFSLDSKSQTFVRSLDATLALTCAAQGSPLPSFR